MKKLFCASMMCADFGNLASEVHFLEEAGVDMFHIDIMDGSFVPNFALGRQDLEFIANATDKPVDVHLMIQNPGAYVRDFAGLGADIIYIHVESDIHAPRTIDVIRDAGASPGIAINPGTSVSTIEPLLPIIDYILVMTVNPGFAGQKYLEFVNEKIDILIELKKQYNYRIIIDGACSPGKIKELSDKGADGFVLGTAALFIPNKSYKDAMREITS